MNALRYLWSRPAGRYAIAVLISGGLMLAGQWHAVGVVWLITVPRYYKPLRRVGTLQQVSAKFPGSTDDSKGDG